MPTSSISPALPVGIIRPDAFLDVAHVASPGGPPHWDVRALLPLFTGARETRAVLRVVIDARTVLTVWCDADAEARGLPLNFRVRDPDGPAVLGPVVLTRQAISPNGAVRDRLTGIHPGDRDRVTLLVPQAIDRRPAGPRLLVVRQSR